MAAKFDGKHARANMWVTHQNLARAKGGRPGYQFQEKRVPRAPKGVAVAAAAEPKPADGGAPSPAPPSTSASQNDSE